MTQDEKLDEALKGTFPASDAFYLSPDQADSAANEQMPAHAVLGLVDDPLDA
jgi:hypothetical protein